MKAALAVATTVRGIPMPDLLTVSDVAARLHREYGVDVPPKYVSDLIYRRLLPASAVTTLAGRRLVRADRFDDVVAALRLRGRLPADDASSAASCTP